VFSNRLCEKILFSLGDGRSIHVSTAVEITIITAESEPEISLQITDWFFESQRFGSIDSGLSADVITGFVVLLDGIASEPSLQAGVVVVKSPVTF
jgi:hypothetical protein